MVPPAFPTLPTEILELILDQICTPSGGGTGGGPVKHSLFQCCLVSHSFLHLSKARLYRDLQLAYSVDEGLASASWGGPDARQVMKNRGLVQTLRLVVGVRAYPSDADKVDKALAMCLRNTFREDFKLDGLAVDFGLWTPGPLALKAIAERLTLSTLQRISVIQLNGPMAFSTLLDGCPATLEEVKVVKLRPAMARNPAKQRVRHLRIESDETVDDEAFEAITANSKASLEFLSLTLRTPAAGSTFPVILQRSSFTSLPCYSFETFTSLRSLHLQPHKLRQDSFEPLFDAVSHLNLPSLRHLKLSTPHLFTADSCAKTITSRRLLHHLPATLYTFELDFVPIDSAYLLSFLEDAPRNDWKNLVLNGEVLFNCARWEKSQVWKELREKAEERGLVMRTWEEQNVRCWCKDEKF
ncbi:hypothetical protein P7C70_g4206, partial [Phenoliferia sp. Uapishka_3]